MWHRIDGARLLDRPCDREERDTNGDRDLRQTRKEGWGPQPARTAPGGGWAECHTDASWSEDRPSLREGGEREAKGPVDKPRLAERVGALNAGRGVGLVVETLADRHLADRARVRDPRVGAALCEHSHSTSPGIGAVIGVIALIPVEMARRGGSMPSSGCAARCVRSLRSA